MTSPGRVALALAVAAAAAGGCAHDTGYGESVRAAARAQAAPPRQRTGAVEGLDSQEAAIVARTYHRSLAPKDVKPAAEDNVILVAPTSAGGARAQPLAPSVPSER